MATYLIVGERVGALGWGDDDDIDEPTWEDVATKLEELANGEHELVTLRLEPALVAGERPPTLFASRDDGKLIVYFRSADYSLHTGRDSYSRDEVERIFQHFYEQLELDPTEEWDPD